MKKYFVSLKNKIFTFCASLGKQKEIDTAFDKHSDTMYASFIVLASGQIQSSNKVGTEFIEISKGYINHLLGHDGFDNATAYRLLNAVHKHSETNNQCVYTSEILPDKTFLITRYKQNSQKTAPHIPNISFDNADNADNDIEVLDTYFNNLEINQQENHEHHLDNTQILSMNKTLRDWIKNDPELLDHLKKFGSTDTKRSIGIIALGDKTNKTSIDIDAHRVFRVFQYFIKNDSDNHTDQQTEGKTSQNVVFPLNIENTSPPEPYNFNIQQNTIEHEKKQNISDVLFKNSPLATIILDKDNIISEYNQSFLDLFELKICQSRLLKDYFPENQCTKIKNSPDDCVIEIHIINPKLRILNVKIYVNETQNYKICYLDDVTAEKSLEQKFNQAQKMQAIGQLAGGVAHDFNNLLTAILGHTELLMNRFSPADLAYADLLQIRNNANRAGNLVRQLLAFSRRQTLKPEIIILTDILPDISRMLERLMGERIILKTNYAPSLKPIKADITQLEQVIINLGVNARDAMEASGGVLTITTENITSEQALLEGHNIMPAMDYVKITVSDTGHGMSDEIKTKIFEPFFTTKEQGKGTGLGLSTVYGIVKQSDGFIFVDSEVNKGTQFRVYFPITHEQKKHIIEIPNDVENHDNLIIHAPHTKTILIVEDEDSVRSFAVRALELRGYKILEADCGEDALDVFKEHYKDIHLIITDVMMPGLSGPEWIQEAQKIQDNLNVIFMSGYTQDYFRDDDAFNLSGIDILFLSKPFSLKSFNEIVQKKLM